MPGRVRVVERLYADRRCQERDREKPRSDVGSALQVRASPLGYRRSAACATAGNRSKLRRMSTAALVRSMNAFGLDLFRSLSSRAESNLFLSPLSVDLALALTLAKARGSMRAELRHVLHLFEGGDGGTGREVAALVARMIAS